MAYCKVAYCRFSHSHVTKGHKCGRCPQYGHGDAECRNQANIRILENYMNDILPIDKQCNVIDCKYKELHTSDAHHCPKCKKRVVHTILDCDQNIETIFVKCPLCRKNNILSKPKKIIGLSDKCCICLENSVEIDFPNCPHCCVCECCLHKIKEQ